MLESQIGALVSLSVYINVLSVIISLTAHQ